VEIVPNAAGGYAGLITLCRDHADRAGEAAPVRNDDGRATCQVCGVRNYGVRVFDPAA
jgi:hypothetical protein